MSTGPLKNAKKGEIYLYPWKKRRILDIEKVEPTTQYQTFYGMDNFVWTQ